MTDEGLTLNLEFEIAGIQIIDHCLIGRVLTVKKVRFANFKERLGSIRNSVKRVSITQADAYRFLLLFIHHLDVGKVMDEGPWLYDNFNMVIERISPGVVLSSVNLNHMDIWVQVH